MAAVELFEGGAFLVDGRTLVAADEAQAFSEQTGRVLDAQEARTQTMAYSIMAAHNTAPDM